MFFHATTQLAYTHRQDNTWHQARECKKIKSHQQVASENKDARDGEKNNTTSASREQVSTTNEQHDDHIDASEFAPVRVSVRQPSTSDHHQMHTAIEATEDRTC